MNISAAGAGSPTLDLQALRLLATPLPDLAAPPLVAEDDSVSPSLGTLATPPMQLLLHVVDDIVSRAAPQLAASPHTLSQTAIAPYVLDAVTLDARTSAEKFVAKAMHTIETGEGRPNRVPDNLDPRTVVALANQFIETGQFPNYMRAAELGRVVISWYDEPSRAKPAVRTTEEPRPRTRNVLKTLWRRAPLLILLTGWLVLGIVANLTLRVLNIPSFETGLALDIWAIGFLALVVFQFVVTIRRRSSI